MFVFFAVRVLIPVDSVDLRFVGAGIDDPEREQELREEFDEWLAGGF